MAGLVNAVPGMSCREPEGAFYIFASIRGLIGKKYRGEVITGSVKFAELLLENELTAVVPGIAFGADDYIRLSYATSEENIKKGLARIEKILQRSGGLMPRQGRKPGEKEEFHFGKAI